MAERTEDQIDDLEDLDDIEDDETDEGAAASGADDDDDDDLEDDDDAATTDDDDDKPEPKNRFNDRRSLTDIADEVVREGEDDPDAATGGKKKDADDDAKGAAGKRGRAAADDDETEAKDPKKAGAKADDDEDEDDEEADQPTKPRYVIRNAAGEELDFDWEKGAAVVFKGDGKEVEVKSMDELVQLGQKGVAFDRLVPELRTRVTQATEHATTLEAQLEELHETADRTLLAALFGPKEVRLQLREKLAKFRDPDFVEGQKAIAREGQRKEADKAQSAQELEESRTEFWQGVGRKMGDLLKTDHFPLLDENDAAEITKRFYGGYEDTFKRTYREYVADGKPKPEAERLAQSAAFNALSDKNLRRVMKQLNVEYNEKLARHRTGKEGKDGKGGKKIDEATARRAIDQHNRTTDEKLAQRDRNPKLRGGSSGGTPPGHVRGRENGGKPLTFGQRMDRAGKILRSAKTGDGGEDDE